MSKSSSNVVPLKSTRKIEVRHSDVHGNGVFAIRRIKEGKKVIEYKGKRITEKQAARKPPSDPDNPFHTFFFSLDDGRMIDGADKGNKARWINHACEPNCEAREEKGRIFIYALREILPGEELNYDYALIVEERHTAKLKRAYECRCGAPTCRGTMLAVKRKPGKRKKKAAESDPERKVG